MPSSRLSLVLRISIIILWIVLFGLLLKRDYFVKTLDLRENQVIKRSREESFAGVYFNNQRIGFVKNRLTPIQGNGYELYQEAYLVLNILNRNHPVRMAVNAQLEENLLLRDFSFTLSSPFYNMKAQGKVDKNTVQLTLDTGKETIKDVLHLKEPPFIATNQRAYLLKSDLKVGEKIKIPFFDPISLSAKDTVMEYQGIEKILIKNRIFNLHHFVETFSGIRINSWLDDQGKVMKEESPAGFVFMAEPEFKATAITTHGPEILSSVSVPVKGRMPDINGLHEISYRLTLPEGGEFELDGDRQKLSGDILSISIEKPSASSAPCVVREQDLASTPYIQSKNKKIVDLSRSLVTDNMPTLTKVKILAAWVYNNLDKRPVLGIPDALTTLETRMGDCNEHAALFTALARSVGIPSRVAAGVTFHEGAFYYHAWNEVCLDGSWMSLDTTRNQIPADITHIRFVTGETKEMIRIGALLGKLTIEPLNGEEQRVKHP